MSIEKFIEALKLNTSIDLEVAVAQAAITATWVNERQHLTLWVKKALASESKQEYIRAMVKLPNVFLMALNELPINQLNLSPKEWKTLFVPSKNALPIENIWAVLVYNLRYHKEKDAKLIELAFSLFNKIPYYIKSQVVKNQWFSKCIITFIQIALLTPGEGLDKVNVNYILEKLSFNSSSLIQSVIANQLASRVDTGPKARAWITSVLERENVLQYLQHVIYFPTLAKLLLEQDPTILESIMSNKDLPRESQLACLPLNSPSTVLALMTSSTREESRASLAQKVTFTMHASNEVIKDSVKALLIEMHTKVIVNMKDSADNQLVILNPFLKVLDYEHIAYAFHDPDLHAMMFGYLPFLSPLQLRSAVPLLTNDELLKYIQSQGEVKRREFIYMATKGQREFLLQNDMHYPSILLDWKQSKENILKQLKEPLDQVKFLTLKNSLLVRLGAFKAKELLTGLQKSMKLALHSWGETEFNTEEAFVREESTKVATIHEITAIVDKLDQLLTPIVVSEEYVDPITDYVMKAPVVLSDGNIVDRSTLKPEDNYRNPFNRKVERSDLPVYVELLSKIIAYELKIIVPSEFLDPKTGKLKNIFFRNEELKSKMNKWKEGIGTESLETLNKWLG